MYQKNIKFPLPVDKLEVSLLLKIIFYFLFYLASTPSSAQPVRVVEKDFMVGSQRFYPMTLNYGLNMVYNNGNYYISPDHSYNISNDFECFTTGSCGNKIQTDFNYISGMKFNSIRITGCSPTYSPGVGLFLQCFRHDFAEPMIVNLPLNPNNSVDPGMQMLFSFYDQLLQKAAAATPAPLKLVFLIMGHETSLDQGEVALWNDYIWALTTHLQQSQYKNLILAYDLMNEPCYHIKSIKTKKEACDIITTWHDIIKGCDPDRLVTIGSCGIGDVPMFDPSILKVDFLSLHTYPEFRPWEDRTQMIVQDRARTRPVTNMFWLNRNVYIPWIIGETALTASSSQSISDGLAGTVTDQADYAQFSLDATCNCGGKGYSWWGYQDVDYVGPSSPNYPQNFFGLLERFYAPSASAEKPAVNVFRNYTSTSPALCPVDYSPLYDENKLYYNTFNHPSIPSKELSATIVDENGQPIKDAVIIVRVDMGQRPPTNPNENPPHLEDAFVTLSDANGYFKAIPKQFGFVGSPPPFPGIQQLIISAPGAETVRIPQYDCPGCVNLPSTIVLNRLASTNTLNGAVGGTNHFHGRETLSVQNTLVLTDANVKFTAGKCIDVNNVFIAPLGASVTMSIAAHTNCDELIGFSTSRLANASEGDESSPVNNENPTTFIKPDLSTESILLFPNPTDGLVTVNLSQRSEEKYGNYSVYNSLGENLLTGKFDKESFVLDLSEFARGVYLVEVVHGQEHFYKKLIIN